MSDIQGDPNGHNNVQGTDSGNTFSCEVWAEFFPKLASFARKKLGSTPRREVDEEDIALSAINSFFTGVRDGRYTVRERGDLWRLLATITARKTTRQHRRFFAEKRGGGRVRGESVFLHREDAPANGLDGFLDPNQMPEFKEQIVATCEDLLMQLNDEKLRTTALMRMEGFSNQEISSHLGCSVARTKQRLSKIRTLWESAWQSQDPPA